MAEFYWVGGSTGTTGSYTNPLGNFSGKTGAENMDWILAFDFNNPTNWREAVWVPFEPYLIYTETRRSPGPGDAAIFAAAVQEDNIIVPRAMAPCLWGGANAAGATVTWFGGGDGGSNSATTTNNALSTVAVDGNWKPFKPTAAYRFTHIGSNGILNAAGGGSTDEYSPLYNAQNQGFTLDSSVWFGASWEDLIVAVAATGGTERLNQLRLKVDLIEVDTTAGISSADTNSGGVHIGKNNIGVFELQCLKNLKTFGSGSTSGSYVATTALLRGNPEYRVKGNFYKIDRTCPVEQTVNGSNAAAPRGSLLLTGVTATYVKVSGSFGSVEVDQSSNIGTMEMFPSNSAFAIFLQNKFDRSQVLVDNGNYGNTSGGNSGGLPSFFLADHHSPNGTFLGQTAGRTTTGTVVLPSISYNGLYVGCQNTSSSVLANEFMIGSPSEISPLAVANNLKFMGNCSINTIKATKTFIMAAPEMTIPTESNIQIGELRMRNCELRLNSTSYFDNWKFGQQVGSYIFGGIIDESDTSTIRLSEGVVLWNDQLFIGGGNLAGSGAGKRNGNTPTISAASFI